LAKSHYIAKFRKKERKEKKRTLAVTFMHSLLTIHVFLFIVGIANACWDLQLHHMGAKTRRELCSNKWSLTFLFMKKYIWLMKYLKG
jgi:hypothetical protein